MVPRQTKDKWPPWPCGVCGRGTLRLKDFVEKETAAWKRRGILEPFWHYEGHFSAWLECDREECSEPAALSGRASVGVAFDDAGNDYPVDTYHTLSISPAPPIIAIPTRCPAVVRVELSRAFSLYFADPTAAGNALRSAVEMILTSRGVRRTVYSKGKRTTLPTHQRIELFRKQDVDTADALMAVKWIGNVGSHPGALTHEDVLDAFEVIEHVLDRFWGDHKKKMAQMITQIIRRKGPRSHLRGRRKK